MPYEPLFSENLLNLDVKQKMDISLQANLHPDIHDYKNEKYILIPRSDESLSS
jgi:hypothetical protein